MASHTSTPVAQGADERGPRERMVIHAADLIGRDGVAATSIGDVITASSAPRGSIYHHFPGGKTQLMTEAVRYAGDFIADRIGTLRSHTAAEAVSDIGDVWRRMLVNTDYQFGCPVLAGGLARGTERRSPTPPRKFSPSGSTWSPRGSSSRASTPIVRGRWPISWSHPSRVRSVCARHDAASNRSTR